MYYLFNLFIQSTPQALYNDTIFMGVVLFFFLSMVIGLFTWLIREIAKLHQKISDSQDKIMNRLELLSNKITEQENNTNVLSIKLEHLADQVPDYKLVFRKFTELDERVNSVTKESKRNQRDIDEINRKIGK